MILALALAGNNFNLIPLMKYLKQENIGCSGLVKPNIFEDCRLTPKNKFKKQPKGSYQGKSKIVGRNGNVEDQGLT